MSVSSNPSMRTPAHDSWWSCESGPRIPFTPNGSRTFTSKAVTETNTHIVEGSGDFPVDMLRYDHAFCLTPIPHPQHPYYGKPWRVIVAFAKPYKPTEARWQSFGWRVVGPGNHIPRGTFTSPLRWRGRCHRCGTESGAFALSYFDSACCICSLCEEEERRHPDYRVMQNTFRVAFQQGHYLYQGPGR